MDKDSKNELWFEPKTYGYGWTPITWQGWALVLGYILVLVLLFLDTYKKSQSIGDILYYFITPFLVGTGLLIFICYKKGGPAKWQWGKRK